MRKKIPNFILWWFASKKKMILFPEIPDLRNPFVSALYFNFALLILNLAFYLCTDLKRGRLCS